MNSYSNFTERLAKVIFIITGAMISAMVLIITYQVFGRFVLDRTPRWSEEFTLVLMLYTGFLGASLAYRERLHIGIKFFIGRVKEPLQSRIYIFIDAMIGVFALFMIIWGSGFAWMMRNQTLPATKISVGVSYLPIPLTGILFLFFVIEKIMSDINAKGEEA